ncbi:MAG: TrkA C-terminal domain-containing protein [Ktedonobacterales bacterium]
MVALVSFLLVLTLSLIIERIATVALTLTGLSRDAAAFQARSAFTGTGFTTSEAEQVVSHPARRRIVLWLMGVRSFEIITGVSALVLLFKGSGSTRESVTRSLWLAAGLMVLGVAASNKWLDRHLSRLIAWVLRRWTTLDVRDYTALLGLTSGYTVWELPVDADSWMADKSLEEMRLPEEGLTVLAIQRAGGSFVGVPHRTTVIRPRDTLILYGHSDRLAELSTRQLGRTGDLAHADAVEAQRLLLRDEELQQDTISAGAQEDRISASTSVGPNRAGS